MVWSGFMGSCQHDSKVRSHQKYTGIVLSVASACKREEYSELWYGLQEQLSVLGFLWGGSLPDPRGHTHIRTQILPSASTLCWLRFLLAVCSHWHSQEWLRRVRPDPRRAVPLLWPQPRSQSTALPLPCLLPFLAFSCPNSSVWGLFSPR